MITSVQSIIEKARDAITYSDASLANELLAQMRVINMQELQKKSLLSYQDMTSLLPKLRAVALPLLSDEDAANVLRNHILLSFDIDVPLESFLSAKLFSVSYFSRHALRKKLQEALLENHETIGTLTIGQWATMFDNKFPPPTRTQSSLLEFLQGSREAQALDPKLKKRLKIILYLYDYLLVSTIPTTKPQLNAVLTYKQTRAEQSASSLPTQSMSLPSQFTRSSASPSFNEQPSYPISLSIEEAMEKYPRVGEQLVTSAPIVLKPFPQPVRPSIKNWIADYHHTLGVGEHGIMERGSYLYNNPNTRTLTEGERKKLALLLKSVDDNTPLSVDAGRQEVAFANPEASDTRSMANETDQGMRSGDMQNSNVRFSSPQKLPVEQAVPNPLPQQNQQHPTKNVVNLREK